MVSEEGPEAEAVAQPGSRGTTMPAEAGEGDDAAMTEELDVCRSPGEADVSARVQHCDSLPSG